MRNYSLFQRFKAPSGNFVRRVLCVVVMLLTVAGYAAPQSPDPQVSISKKNEPLKSVLLDLEKQTGFTFFYNNQLIDVQKRVSVTATNKRLSVLLSELLTGENLQYKIMGKQIALYPKGSNADDALGTTLQQEPTGVNAPKLAQQDASNQKSAAGQEKKTIKGTVTSFEDGTPLEFISVVVKGTRDYAVTDKKGNYTISTDKADGVLEFSLIGLATLEEPINERGTVNVRLRETANELDAVVVTGYQTISKERVTGSFSVVNSELLQSQMALTLASGLEGRVAGVVSNNDGDFVIRGTSTMNAIQSPLYVIDGFPVEGDDPELRTAQIAQGGAGRYISYSPPSLNPSDIESVTVLKDAAAASIYGSRAANGVIVITTKKAKQGAAQIFFSGDMTIRPVSDLEKRNYISASRFIDFEYDYLSRYPRIQNPATRIAEINSYRANNNPTPTMDLLLSALEGKLTQEEADRQIDAYRSDGLPPYARDFMDYIYRPTINQQYYLSVGKAIDRNNFLGSITYNDNRGNTKNFEGNSLEVNLRNTLVAAKWLDVELNANVRSSNDRKHLFAPLGTTATNGVISALSDVTAFPYARLVDADGNPTAIPSYFGPSILDNYKAYASSLQNLDIILQDEQNRNIENSNTFRTRAGSKLNFKITDWLTFLTGFQYETSFNKKEVLYNKESIGMRLDFDDFSYYDNVAKTVVNRMPYGDSHSSTYFNATNYTQRNQLTLNLSSKDGRHSVVALAGTETRQSKVVSESSRVYGYDSELLSHKLLNNYDLSMGKASILGRGSKAFGGGQSFSEVMDRFVSLFGNASYTFNNRYDITGSIRWDLSNLFGTDPKYQYRPFWSVGAGWNVNQEKFMSDLKWINRLKLRATYGINGNIAKTAAPYLIASYSKSSITDQYVGSVLTPPNAGLRWERTQVANIGVDFSLLQNRLTGSIDAYNKYTDDILSNSSIDATYGFSTMTLNVGAVLNRGVEVDLRGILLQRSGWHWMMGFTFAYNRNKVTKVFYKPSEASSLYSPSSIAPPYLEGYPLNSMYSYRFVRIDDKGETVILNEKGEEVSLAKVSSIDAVEFSGSLDPLCSGSLYSTLSYKGIELSFNFIYNAGHVMRKVVTNPHMNRPTGMMSGNYDNNWQQLGDEFNPNVTPRLTYSYDANTNNRNDHWRYNNHQVVSASYIKLRSLTLSYSLARLLQHSFLKNATIKGQVSNLFWLSANGEGSDPENYTLNTGSRGITMPTYYLGFNLSF